MQVYLREPNYTLKTYFTNYTNASMTDIQFKVESYKIIGACVEVHKKLGSGFLKSVYSEALEIEFKTAGMDSLREGEEVA